MLARAAQSQSKQDRATSEGHRRSLPSNLTCSPLADSERLGFLDIAGVHPKMRDFYWLKRQARQVAPSTVLRGPLQAVQGPGARKLLMLA